MARGRINHKPSDIADKAILDAQRDARNNGWEKDAHRILYDSTARDMSETVERLKLHYGVTGQQAAATTSQSSSSAADYHKSHGLQSQYVPGVGYRREGD